MKTETIQKGNALLSKIEKLAGQICELVDGRIHYYDKQQWNNDGTGILHRIVIHTSPEAGNNDDRKLDLNFDGQEKLYGDLSKLISPEAAQAITYASLSYRDRISSILLREEIALKKEFENLKDE
jgi:hypothetical protein